MTIRRDDALRALVPLVRDDDIVVAVYQANFDWMAINPRPLNYVAVGAMGQAASHGLGFALANPERRVFVFDGDGSLLMNLGALVTVAGAGVTNFYHFVFANRVYEVNGDQPIPNAENVDFAGFAAAAGYAMSRSFDDLDEFAGAVPRIIELDGPQMVSLETVPGESYPRNYDYIHSAGARKTFEDALNGRK
ncbi:MAG: thiamine pyrophosphate-dependent enzyme [Boseongicola sp.]|nr:thiamine pyrophosphate-dependent enzyme [Boseongicola sp.]